jgi:transcriptional regulator with XRE-family HTH domain
MASAGIGWSWSDLAKAADISRDTLARFLRGEAASARTVEAIRKALEDAGVVVIGEGEESKSGGLGVRLADSAAPARAKPAKTPAKRKGKRR